MNSEQERPTAKTALPAVSDRAANDEAEHSPVEWVTGDELLPGDAYMEGPYMVFTAQYHLRRGYCCNSICRHCPYRDAEGCA